MSIGSRNKFITFLLMFYYWLRGIALFFVPRSYKSKSVKGELVLITGGGSGLGRAMAIRFAQLGAHVVVWDINKSGLDETIKLIKHYDVTVKSYVCDITDRHAVYETAAKVKQDIGDVTVLVNNAGVVTGKKFLDMPDEKILQTFHVNTISHFWTLKAFLPAMISKNEGHLVSIASIAGQQGCSQMSDYCASKFAAVGLEESLRLELLCDGYTGIKSSVVLPFFVNTGMFAGFQSAVLPSLEPDYMADEIISGVLTEKEYIVVPKSLLTLNVLKQMMPTKANYKLFELLDGRLSLIHI